MSRRHSDSWPLAVKPPTIGPILLVLPVIPDGAPFRMREGIARRRLAAGIAVCPAVPASTATPHKGWTGVGCGSGSARPVLPDRHHSAGQRHQGAGHQGAGAGARPWQTLSLPRTARRWCVRG